MIEIKKITIGITEQENQGNFPNGLPDNLLQKEKSGVIRLFSLLQISRDMRRAIVSDLPKTQKQKNLSERENLILCYSRQDNRFKLFESFVQKHKYFEKVTSRTLGLLGKTHHTHKGHKTFQVPIMIPSLEFQILSKYLSDFLELSYDEEKLASAITNWQEIYQTIKFYDDYIKSCLMVWLKAQEDLKNWATLSDEQKNDLANAVFALASIADSFALLLQAVQQVPELKDYYSQLFNQMAEAEANSSVKLAKDKTKGTDDSASLEEVWKLLCLEIIDQTQQALEKAPSIEFIETFDKLYQKLQVLRELIPVKEKALEMFNQKLTKLEAYLVKLSQQKLFDWLLPNVEKLLLHWSSSVQKLDTVEEINQITQDLDRVFVELTLLFETYQAFCQQFNQLTEKLSSLSLDEQQVAVAELANINQQRLTLRENILNSASPFKEDFASQLDNTITNASAILPTTTENFPSENSPIVLEKTITPSKALEVISSLAMKKEMGDTKPNFQLKTNQNPLSEKIAAQVKFSPPVILQAMPIAEPVAEVTLPAKEEPLTVKKEKISGADQSVLTPPFQKANKTSTLQFTTKSSSQKIAHLLLNHQPNTKTYFELLNALVWRLIYDNRLGLAYHIAPNVESINGPIFVTILRALALSRLIHSEAGEVILELQSDILQITSFFKQKTEQELSYLNMLSFGLALRPTLLAPTTTGARELLKTLSLDKNFSALHDLRKAILEYTSLDLVLTPDVLKGVGKKEHQAESLQLLRAACQKWLEKSREAKFKYGRTTRVWKHWLKEDESLGSMLTTIIQDDRHKKHEVAETIKMFSEDNLSQLLHKTDRELRGRKANVKPIDATKETLYKHTQTALQFAQDWLKLIKEPKEEVKSFFNEQANNCRTKVMSCLQQSQVQLQVFLQQNSPRLEITGSVLMVHRALQNLQTLFEPQKLEIPFSLSWQYILHAELLRIPPLQLDEQWQRQAELSPTALLNFVMELLRTEASIDWEKAFKEQCEVCNHLATQRIIDFIIGTGLKTSEELPFIKERQEKLIACYKKLGNSFKETRAKIERATVSGLLTEMERLNLLSILDKTVPANVTEIFDFQSIFYKMIKIAEQLDNREKNLVQKLEEKLQKTAIQTKQPAVYQRIKAVLEQGDFLTAKEYLAKVEAGSPIPKENNFRDAFSDFFPHFVDELMTVLGRERKNIQENIKDIANGKGFFPLNLQYVPKNQAKAAAKMLESWLIIRQQKGNELVEHLQNILEGIGFQNGELRELKIQISSYPPFDQERLEEIYLSHADKCRWFEMRFDSIQDRNICIIPQFGSIAQGYYRILCLWGQTSEEEILTLTIGQTHEIPIIVCYFGRLTTQKRYHLASLCRERRRTLLVVDETLIYFLCGERGLRLPILFQCTFPFSAANPFITTGSFVPVEMFFGRKWQQEAIFDPFSTNILYGGRQLGKTALLRDVERQYHNPKAGIVVLWIDLKAEKIGLTRSPQDIWLVIANALTQEGIVEPQTHKIEAIVKQIQNWLSLNPQRRILLLLDEADSFLSQKINTSDNKTSSDFQTLTLTLFKNLMEITHRRFKVVFAGLHHVQRMARDINTPIAHLSAPICIGPLLGNGEQHEARKLITSVFFMLGYRFESQDLPNRILGLTHYYPSLIQLFCWHLLEMMTEKNHVYFDVNKNPPYVIQTHHIEEAYQRPELRKAILYRFQLSLDLDPRYRVIALRILLESVERRQHGILYRGFEIAWLRKEALSLWNKGFEDKSYEAFRTLLDEMTGLGILRKIDNCYDLRSSNLIDLFDSQTEIEEALLDATEKSAPLEYEITSFRRTSPNDIWLRSPLTGQQESELLDFQDGVAVLLGAPIAGLFEIEPFLELACQSNYWKCQSLDSVMDSSDFQKQLQDALQQRNDAYSQLILIPSSVSWNENWLLEANKQLQDDKRSFQTNTRILFIGGCQKAWLWVNADTTTRNALHLTTHYSLQPWREAAVRYWLNDVGFGEAITQDNKLAGMTGYWSSLLQSLKSQHTDLWEKHLSDLDAQLNHSPEKWLAQLDLVAEAIEVFSVMSSYNYGTPTHPEYEPITIEELTQLSEQPYELVEKVIEWADLLNFIKPDKNDTWILEPLIARLISQQNIQ